MTDEEYVMSLAKVKFEQRWDMKRLADELGISYIWCGIVMNRKTKISRALAQKIQFVLTKYNCEPWKEPKQA